LALARTNSPKTIHQAINQAHVDGRRKKLRKAMIGFHDHLLVRRIDVPAVIERSEEALHAQRKWIGCLNFGLPARINYPGEE
jgi:hypothetical protein